MAQRRIYANPPLVEALCDIRFEPGQEWDWTIPGLLYAHLQDDYPLKEQVEHFAIKIEEGKAQQQTNRRMRFSREDKTALVQVGEDALVVNCLRPYPTWDGFRCMVANAVEKYRAVAGPVGVSSCAVRYINKIKFPGPSAILEQYLLTYPVLPKNLPERLAGWSLALDIPDPAHSGLMRLSAGSTSPDEGTAAFLIDLRFLATEPEGLGLDDGTLLNWIDTAHDVIEETFEASITSDARALFNEEEPAYEQLLLRG